MYAPGAFGPEIESPGFTSSPVSVTSVPSSVTDFSVQPGSVTDYVAVVFASESSRWGYQSRYVRVARPDQTGRFVISGLPAGSYLGVALEYAEPGQETDAEFLDSLKQSATTIRLADAEKKTVTLRLSSR